MTDARVGETVAQVSDITSTDGVDVIDQIPMERPYVVVFYVADDDDYPGVDQFHDVVTYEVGDIDAHGPFDRAQAAEYAVEQAREMEYPLVNAIFEYHPYIREFIDESGNVPEIRGTRISLLDVMAVIEGPGEAEESFEHGELTDDQVEAALQYYEANKEELHRISKEQYD